MSKKVLIIDDELELVKAVEVRLKSNGYEVITANDGKSGIDKAVENMPDIILLDIIMPNLTGYEVAKKLLSNPKTSAIPIIVFTASQEKSITQMCGELGVCHVIKKPFETRNLLDIINDMLNKDNTASKKKRILLVDDEEDLLKAMKIRLESWGYTVTTASSGEDALNFIQKELPDAIILDIMMPVMNGIETLKKIRQVTKAVPVFMLTAYSDKKNIDETLNLGISGFIPKGNEFLEASDLIRAVLRMVKQ